MTGTRTTLEWRGRPVAAFLPEPLADRSLALPAAVTRRADAALAAAARPRTPGPLPHLLRRVEGVASAALDGPRAAVSEVLAAEAGDPSAPLGAVWVADTVAALGDALDHARGRARLRPADLHRWHARLGRRAGDGTPGGTLRDGPAWAGGRTPATAAYVAPPPADVPALVDDLVAAAGDADAHPVALAAAVEAQLAAVRPYPDANGRVGRLVAAWVLARRVGPDAPLALSAVRQRDPDGYAGGLVLLREGEIAAGVDRCAADLAAAAEAAAGWGRELEGVLVDWKGRLDGVRSDAAARALVDVLPARPVLSSEQASAAVAVSATAARTGLDELVARGVLVAGTVPSGPGRPRRWWRAPALAELLARWVR